MQWVKDLFPKKQRNPDWVLLFITLALVAFGMIILFSASYGYGQTKFNDGYYYVKKQLRGLFIGIILLLVISRIDYKKLLTRNAMNFLYITSIALLALCFIPVIGGSDGVNDAKRWIFLPFISFQPSEYSKFAIIVFEAALISKFKEGAVRNSRQSVLLCIATISPMFFLLILQPNFSVFMITAMTFSMLLFFSGLKWRDIVIYVTIFAIIALIIVFQRSYRARRILNFLNPSSQEYWETGEQQNDSMYALGSGGVFGLGLGKSKMKFDFLAYGESDFILAIIGEEFGLVGLVTLLVAYVLLLFRGYRAAIRSSTRFGMLSAAGVTTLIGIQTFIHISVGVGIMPTTGVTLPFISHGSTSLMCFMGAIGFLMSVSRDSKEDERRAVRENSNIRQIPKKGDEVIA